ncbi:DoxX family protein [Glycomyces buryatensis]|uniref:DoxX family protein n=1 Tax=Glycomyces buryatensis TaxID=2570927 RepID=A0A4S8QFN8_9ACTN|nr:DoxX family protein [Glycomyces buryatensis]THV42491.1 DoxX family protein [Glycomyces buryatensis]
MFTAYLIVTLVTIAANAAEAVANFAKIPFVRNNVTAIDGSVSWLPWLGIAKGAAAAGLTLGLLGWEPLGLAAAIGLVVFFICAMVAHIRAKVFYNIYGPILFLGLSIATLALMLAQ